MCLLWLLVEVVEVVFIVINCVGLGVWELVGDVMVWLWFGQYVVFINLGLEKLFIECIGGLEWICYFVYLQCVVCGGISIFGRWDFILELEIIEWIL